MSSEFAPIFTEAAVREIIFIIRVLLFEGARIWQVKNQPQRCGENFHKSGIALACLSPIVRVSIGKHPFSPPSNSDRVKSNDFHSIPELIML
jgi:hypothetical protein